MAAKRLAVLEGDAPAEGQAQTIAAGRQRMGAILEPERLACGNGGGTAAERAMALGGPGDAAAGTVGKVPFAGRRKPVGGRTGRRRPGRECRARNRADAATGAGRGTTLRSGW